MLAFQFPINTDMYFVRMLNCHFTKVLIPSRTVPYFRFVPCKIHPRRQSLTCLQKGLLSSRPVTERAFQVQVPTLFFFRTQLGRIASKFNSKRGKD